MFRKSSFLHRLPVVGAALRDQQAMVQRIDKIRGELRDLRTEFESERSLNLRQYHGGRILLTTFPYDRSENVGDNMISASFLALLRARKQDIDPKVLFRQTPLDGYEASSISAIFAPGFSVANGTYPNLYKLFNALERLQKFHPFACSFQSPLPGDQVFHNYVYDADTLRLLTLLNKISGPIPCRDQMIVDLLTRHDIEAYFCGDIVLFDEMRVGTPFVPPTDVTTVAFTLQHHARYLPQSHALLRLIADLYPGASKHFCMHSKKPDWAEPLLNEAMSLGFVIDDLKGDAFNLAFYDSCDLHVGYRLHGHISFLRRRKPSVLLVEDARAHGLSRTEGFRLGCFDAMEDGKVNFGAVDQIRDFLTEMYAERFASFQATFDVIDSTYKRRIRPYFDDLAAKL